MALTPRQAGALAVAFILGGVAAVVSGQLLKDTGTNPASETVALGAGTFGAAGTGPVRLSGKVVQLPEGYEQRQTPAAPTLTLVESGQVQIEDAAGSREYLAGTSFVRSAGVEYTIRVQADAQLATVSLLSAR